MLPTTFTSVTMVTSSSVTIVLQLAVAAVVDVGRHGNDDGDVISDGYDDDDRLLVLTSVVVATLSW